MGWTRGISGRVGAIVVGGWVLGAGAGLGLGADEPLRWKLRAGESLRYESVQTTTGRLKDPTGQEVGASKTLTMNLTWRVREVDPQGAATVVQTIDRIRNAETSPLGKFSFDSQDAGDAAGPAGGMAKVLIGAEFSFKLSPRGEFSEIQVPAKVVAGLRGGGDPDATPGQDPEAMFRNLLIQSGVPLPEGAAGPGQSWNRKVTLPAGPDKQAREVEQTYTAKGPETEGGKGLVGIDMATKFGPPPADPNVPLTIRVQEATGHFAFDPARGRIDSSRVVEKVEVAATIEGKEVTQASETTTRMTLQP